MKPPVTDNVCRIDGNADTLSLSSLENFDAFATEVMLYLENHVPWAEHSYTPQEVIEMSPQKDMPIDPDLFNVDAMKKRAEEYRKRWGGLT